MYIVNGRAAYSTLYLEPGTSGMVKGAPGNLHRNLMALSSTGQIAIRDRIDASGVKYPLDLTPKSNTWRGNGQPVWLVNIQREQLIIVFTPINENLKEDEKLLAAVSEDTNLVDVNQARHGVSEVTVEDYCDPNEWHLPGRALTDFQMVQIVSVLGRGLPANVRLEFYPIKGGYLWGNVTDQQGRRAELPLCDNEPFLGYPFKPDLLPKVLFRSPRFLDNTLFKLEIEE
ncbi:MAG: hypothetical protein NT099_02050 [Candidatus Saganbacteria bacterium]|nr:hypothetical protein [Candidatus Saganbacteria bacterium]